MIKEASYVYICSSEGTARADLTQNPIGKENFMKTVKTILSIALCTALALSIVPVPTSTVSATSGPLKSGEAYYIWLKEDPDNTVDAPLNSLRSLKYRWNINGNGTSFNQVVHLDYASGNNCEMVLYDAPGDYYGIKYQKSKYYIDVEHNNGNTGNVLHQYHKDLDADNQYFRFVPVSGEADTYYIMSKKGNNLYIGTQNGKKEQHTKIATTNKATKWVVKKVNEPALTGQEASLTGNPNANPRIMINPAGYSADANVNLPGGVGAYLQGNRLHLYHTGESAKIHARWDSQYQAYRLESQLNWERNLNELFPINQQDLVWDVDGQSLNDNAVIHVWSEHSDNYDSQLWRFIPTGESTKGGADWYYIYNVNSKLYLSIEKKEDTENVKLIQSKKKLPWEVHIVDQDDLYSYKKNETLSKVTPGNWMAHLPDSMYLSELNIPGTHDAGAARMMTDTAASMSQTICQQLYLDEQLNMGVRAWDIRVDKASAQFEEDANIVHGFSAMCCRNKNGNILEIEEVMQTARDFLKTHPSETIIMTIKGDGKAFGNDNDVVKAMKKFINDSSYPIYRPSADKAYKVPTLGEVRGKIVLIRRLNYSKENGDGITDSDLRALGMDASKWDDNDYSEYTKAQKVSGCDIYVQDNYSEGNAEKKLKYFDGTINDATANRLTANGKAYLFNYSGAKDNLSQPRAINKALMKDPLLDSGSKDSMKNTVGIVMANYIDGKLSTRIYMTNFLPDCKHNYTDEGICKICGDYQPADYDNKTENYKISNKGQLMWFSAFIRNDKTNADFENSNRSANAILTNDIELTDEWTPPTNYSGVFDGQGHTVKGLKITGKSDSVGFIGHCKNATVKNLTLMGEISITKDISYIGGAIGRMENATIENVKSSVKISNTSCAPHHVGGVVGSTNGNCRINGCAFYGEITISNTTDCIGGVVGYTRNGGQITNCANYGTVTASANGAVVGGVLAYVNTVNATVKNCMNIGTANSDNTTSTGGIIGLSRQTCTVKNNYYLAGKTPGAGSSTVSGNKNQDACTSKTAAEFASGEVAYLLNESSTGNISWYQNLGGSNADSYPLLLESTHGIVWKSDTGYENMAMKHNSQKQYEISSYEDLRKMAMLVTADNSTYGNANYVLTQTISIPDDAVWDVPIGTQQAYFNGTFEGNNHLILGLDITSGAGGLFGYIGENGSVQNLYTAGVTFDDSSEAAGGIAAYNYGKITNCTCDFGFSGNSLAKDTSSDTNRLRSYIRGILYAGGIAGVNHGEISSCRSGAEINDAYRAGGITGSNHGLLSACANTGTVGTADLKNNEGNYFGGLAGIQYAAGSIQASYNTGKIHTPDAGKLGGIFAGSENSSYGKVADCFWANTTANGADRIKLASANARKLSINTMKSKSFIDTLNKSAESVTSGRKWIWNEHFNQGYPFPFDASYENQQVVSADGVQFKGYLNKYVSYELNECTAKDSLYSDYASKLSGILSVYRPVAVLKDRTIPTDFWASKDITITLTQSEQLNDKIQVAYLKDGALCHTNLTKNEDGTYSLTLPYMTSFALVPKGSKGTSFTGNGLKYTITEKPQNGNGTAMLIGSADDSGLTKLTVPDTVSYDGSNLKVTAIGEQAFSGNTKLKNVSIGKYVKNIGNSAFAECKNLASVSIGTALTAIGSKAFYKDPSLKSLTIKSKYLKTVGSKAIDGIYSKAVINIPKGQYSAYQKLFSGSAGFQPDMTLKSSGVSKGSVVTVDGLKYKVTSVSGNGSGTATLTGASKKLLSKLNVPAKIPYQGYGFKVTAIGKKAFSKKKLKSVVIGDNVKTIGDSAFAECKKLTSVTIGTGMVNIGNKVFYHDKALKTITIRSKYLKKVGNKAVSGIHRKAVIKVPSGKYSSYKKLFRNKTGFTSEMKLKKSHNNRNPIEI